MKKLLRGHREFRREYVAGSRQFLARLASEHQSPDALYVGCSDSRVIPELPTSSSPGELFVVRNVANLVPPADRADASVGAALEYGVMALHVHHLVVCGHYGCGGVKAMIDGMPAGMPELASWLELAAAANAVARDASLPAEARWRRAVEENVLDQVANLSTYPCVRQGLEAGNLTLHAWVYDLVGGLAVWDGETEAFIDASLARA